MTPEEIKSLKKIAKELENLIAEAEESEDGAETPIVLTPPSEVAKNKKKLLE